MSFLASFTRSWNERSSSLGTGRTIFPPGSYELRLMQNLPSKVDEGQRRQAVTQVCPSYYDHSRELGCDTQGQPTPCVGMRLLQVQVFFGLGEGRLHDRSSSSQLLLQSGVQL